MSKGFRFEMVQTVGAARRGRLTLPHAEIDTPTFMPVGTQATVKAMLPDAVARAGFGLILSNTYHLAMRPGPELIAAAGGLHQFMGWDGAILTDSGGFQVFSLAALRRLDDDGVTFRSHVDGSEHRFTPERAVAIQEALGSDIAMALDVCPPSTAPRAEVERALELTTRWARRCFEARSRPDQAMFGIVQGGLDLDLRRRHAAELGSLPFEGMAIGGLSVGESPDEMIRVTAATAAVLPADRPRYLMGVGTPVDLVRGASVGIDLFDCVYPTRVARNGMLLTSTGAVIIKHAAFREDLTPPDPDCDCPCCSRFSRAYLAHLFRANEILWSVLATTHNLHFVSRLMAQVREAIEKRELPALISRIEAAFGSPAPETSPGERRESRD